MEIVGGSCNILLGSNYQQPNIKTKSSSLFYGIQEGENRSNLPLRNETMYSWRLKFSKYTSMYVHFQLITVVAARVVDWNITLFFI